MGVPNPVDTMDHPEFYAVYIDDRVQSERWVDRTSSDPSLLAEEPESLRSDVELLLQVCKQIYLCQVGTSLATKLAELSDNLNEDCTPIFAFFDIELGGDDSIVDRRRASRGSWSDASASSPSPTLFLRACTFSSQSESSYGLQLLSGVCADIQVQEAPNLIIPIAILRHSSSDLFSVSAEQQKLSLPDPQQISRCLDAGAVDVLTTPLDRSRVQGLIVHAYRARKTALKDQSRFLARKKNRKQSWVGVYNEQPYAYLREAMVSKLMKGICNPENVIEEFQDRELNVPPERKEYVKQLIGTWNFKVHELSEDELVFGACEMLQHAFSLPNLEQWQLTPCELKTFLLACRASYNSFVLYHNFRHAIDVLQSVFFFLLHIGALPPYGSVAGGIDRSSPMASLLSPFDTLTLMISAIGHDVGHPGVNNFFLVKLNSPLAQLYNDNSVLEAFHCAAFSQILRRYWPAAFKDRQLRKLLISSILATDMGIHQKFMEQLGFLQEKFHENKKSVDGWKPQDVETYKSLVCGLLIKCADISNVSRPWDVAEKWTEILQQEFANQGEMEKEVGMETALFGGPPELGNVYKLATGQIGFMSMFALPLFEGVSDLLPQLQFTVDQIRSNQSQWHYLADIEKKKQFLQADNRTEHILSPRSLSPESRSAATGDYFASQRPSISSASRSDCTETIISPVVSPDNHRPSVMPVNALPSSRRSSSAVPDLTMIPIAGSLPDRNVSGPSHSSRDPAAAIFFRTSVIEDDARDHSDTYNTRNGSTEGAAERPSSSQHGSHCYRRYHANTNSSECTSGPSNSQRNSGTGAHSVSNYSNTMTPISPSTNATSFIITDSGDEKGLPRENGEHEESDSVRPGSSNRYTSPERHTESHYNTSDSNTSNSHVDDADKGHIMTSVVGNGGASPSRSTTTAESKNEDQHWDDSLGIEQPTRKLPKRKSRLRLAFWKRKNHHSHQQELSYDT